VGAQADKRVQLVSTEWLEQHLLDENLMILDVQPNVHDYIQEHLPGAIYMNEGLLRVPLNGIPAFYIPEQAFELLVERVGLSEKAHVAVYTGKGAFSHAGDGLGQTMMAYALARFGYTSIYVLDGGIDKWKEESRPLSNLYPEVVSARVSVKLQPDLYVTYDQFIGIKDEDDVLVLDARPPAFYEGRGPWRKPGHIPGAVNLPWKSLMDPENTMLLRPLDDIRAMLDQVGATPEKTIICSCGTGREGSNEFLLLKWYLGYPKVKLYEGSFTEWVAYPDNPTVTGPSPR
jgi:thiosulfate/3-mercaptopyruvate sulfurtransferase